MESILFWVGAGLISIPAHDFHVQVQSSEDDRRVLKGQISAFCGWRWYFTTFWTGHPLLILFLFSARMKICNSESETVEKRLQGCIDCFRWRGWQSYPRWQSSVIFLSCSGVTEKLVAVAVLHHCHANRTIWQSCWWTTSSTAMASHLDNDLRTQAANINIKSNFYFCWMTGFIFHDFYFPTSSGLTLLQEKEGCLLSSSFMTFTVQVNSRTAQRNYLAGKQTGIPPGGDGGDCWLLFKTVCQKILIF